MTEVLQIIDGDGQFHRTACDGLVNASGPGDQRNNYQVVAIMGPQSSGKSTLMNHLFGTTFEMMRAEERRGQTTKGVWIAKSPKIDQPATLVMDLEGSDSRERGEDDSNFERQSALFALATADVLLINLWMHDIGREHGSGKPLMKTIMQVNLKLFAPEPNRARTVLLFIIRDKSVTPIPVVAKILMDDLKSVWDTMSKPEQYKGSSITDFFDVQVVGLSSAQDKYDDFVADTTVLRRRFKAEGEESLVKEDPARLPLDALPYSLAEIWQVIRSQKDLNLPAHKVMVANVRCNEIKEDQLAAFGRDQAWQGLSQQCQQELVPEFGELLAGLLDSCIDGYDQEAMYFDAKVREVKREELVAKLHALAEPCYSRQLALLVERHLSAFDQELRMALAADVHAFADAAHQAGSAELTKFQAAVGEVAVPGTPFTGAEGPDQLQQAIQGHMQAVKGARVKKALGQVHKGLEKRMAGPVVGLLDTFPGALWSKLHTLSRETVSICTKELLMELRGYDLSDTEAEDLVEQLRVAAEAKMEGHVKEAALTKASRMKDRFHELFIMDEGRNPRTWHPREDIPKIACSARAAAANVLAQLAVIRRPEQLQQRDAAGDVVERAVLKLVQQDINSSPGSSMASMEPDDSALDILSAASWPGVDPNDVLVEPHEVRTAWREFMSASNVAVQQALATQQANRLASNRAPPLWAIAAIIFLGWNELMAVVWNPVLLLVGLATFLFCRTMYVELDVDAEMQKGALPGGIALAGKFMPTLQRVSTRTMDSARQLLLQNDAAAAGQRKRQEDAIEMSSSSRGSAGGRQEQHGAGVSRQQHPSGPGLSRRRAEGSESVAES